MSRSVNRVTLIGNAGGDPRVTETKKGTKVAHVSMATNRVFTVDGEEERRTDWHRLTFWGASAETVGRYLRKGSRLYVDGRIEYGSYEKEGVTVPSVDVVVRDFVLLDSAENGSRDGATEAEEREEAGLGA
ncbi:MAG: single-stranded DNA-binding protein [Gemmatimonadota bacterium]